MGVCSFLYLFDTIVILYVCLDFCRIKILVLLSLLFRMFYLSIVV